MILRSYKDRKKLEELARLSGEEGGFGDYALHLEAMRSLPPLLERVQEAGKGVTEEEVLDRVMVLGVACNRMSEWSGCLYCIKRAKKGYEILLGRDSAKAVGAAFAVTIQTLRGDEKIAELSRLWEMAKVSLPDEAVTYRFANDLGSVLDSREQYEEAKVLWLAALEGFRRVLGGEHKHTLSSLNNMGCLLDDMEDYGGALDYFQQALRVPGGSIGEDTT